MSIYSCATIINDLFGVFWKYKDGQIGLSHSEAFQELYNTKECALERMKDLNSVVDSCDGSGKFVIGRATVLVFEQKED